MIETVNEFKLLGITIDKNKTWKLHVKKHKIKPIEIYNCVPGS